MTAEVTPELAEMLRATHEAKVNLFKKVVADEAVEFFDAVVVTSADDEQTATYEANIKGMLEQGRLPKQTKYLVYADPPGRKVGCGGATLYVLDKLEQQFGKGAAESIKVLLIHAGGYSKRLPNHSHCGKIFSLLPVPSPTHPKAAMSMLELKLATFTHVPAQIQKGSGGVFVTCSDDLIFYDHEACDFSAKGFTALGHPSPVSIGKDHGVFVLEKGEATGKPKPGLVKATKFIHKYSIDDQIKEGAVIGKTADGQDEVLTDSCYFFSGDVAGVLLKLFREEMNSEVTAEVDAYGDFMQCTGSGRSDAFMDGFGNTAKTDAAEKEALKATRRLLYTALSRTELNCINLPDSRFFHVGTMKEALHHFCCDPGFLTCLGSPPAPEAPKPLICKIESLLSPSAAITGPSIIEFSRVSQEATVGSSTILSGVTVPDNCRIPEKVFMQTLPVRKEAVGMPAGVGYVTHVLGTDDDIKKAGDTLVLLGHEFEIPEKPCSLWSSKLFPVCDTPEASFQAALDICASATSGKAPAAWSSSEVRLVSLAECVVGKALSVQAAHRKQLLSEL